MYTPLLNRDSFRLMVLEPGSRDDPIRVHLCIWDTASAPKYDAISYVWGDPTQTVEIVCNAKAVQITATLHWALSRVRLPNEPRTVWADALCINQDDLAERSQQVMIMGTIYAGARHVLACLGDDPDGEAGNIASLLDRCEAPAAESSVFGLPTNMQRGFALPSDDRWRAVGTLMKNKWFSRVWVLQEVGLAKNPRVLYGKAEFSYRGLMAAIRWIRRRTGNPGFEQDVPSLLIHTEWADWSEAWKCHPLFSQYTRLDLLDHAALLSCRDPKDHIYALLGHPVCQSTDGSGPIIKPDYRKGTLMLYKEVTELLLKTDGLRTLASVEHDVFTIDHEAPTWVVRWDIGDTLNNLYNSPKCGYHASRDQAPSRGLQLNNARLEVEGIVLDKVALTFKMSLPTESGIEFLSHSRENMLSLQDLIGRLGAENTPCVYGSRRLEQIGLTLCGNSGTDKQSQAVREQFDAYSMWYRSTLVREFLKRVGKYELVVKYAKLINGICHSRSFIVTEKGYYGLAPWITKPGDVCSVFLGADVPFILRPRSGYQIAADEFRLVGESYVQGFMNGEAVELMRAGQFSQTMLRIY
jgi:hypothetical protein